MKKQKNSYIKNILGPCFLFSGIAGAITGALIFLFKITSSKVMHLSADIYSAIRANPKYLPLALLIAAAIGLLAALILKFAKDCRGGGIPTAVAAMRGLMPIKWIQGIFVLFFSAMLTYLCGVPLGNEGPSVQMGTAVGKGTTRVLTKKNRAWERYVMTGGACAGFATATGAPISGILFAVEEAHRRFSPMIFMVATVSVLTGSMVQTLLSSIFHVDTALFDFKITEALPLKFFWVPVLIGAACGLCAILFTKLYNVVRKFVKTHKKIPVLVRISPIFIVSALFGFLCDDFIGSGHSLIEKSLHENIAWYILLAALAVRALVLICANNVGVSGGIFIPTLTFGAIIAALMAKPLLLTSMIGSQYYALFIVVGMSSFLSASSRTPITALVFAVEALCGVNNVLPVGIGVIVAYLIIEISGWTAFTDNIIEGKAEAAHEGRVPVIINAHVVVNEGSFAVGKEVRDILWPTTCAVLSIDRRVALDNHNFTILAAGDVLHIHYQTYDAKATVKELTYLLGEQPEDPSMTIKFGSSAHVVPAAD